MQEINEKLTKDIQDELKKFSGNFSLKNIARLKGDASNRVYYRLEVTGFEKPTMVLMAVHTVDRGIVSEEIIKVSKKFIELPFLNIQRFLFKIGARVPVVYHHSKNAEFVFLEDFGDRLMHTIVSNSNRDEVSKIYRTSIEQLLHLQFNGIKNKDKNCYAFWHSFDDKLLMWEFAHFIEYGIEKRTGKIREAYRRELYKHFEKISGILAQKPTVLTHRDYHSRNLMVIDSSLGILDFQDALLGLPHYDLASLLRDSYIDLDENIIDEMVKYYIAVARENFGVKWRPADFRETFDLASIQRNLKAAGRFHYIHQVKKNPDYLQYLPGTLRKVKTNLLKYKWLRPLYNILAEYTEELR